MKLNIYLSKFAELKTLYEVIKLDFLSEGLVHHNWSHTLRDLAKGIIICEKEKANTKIVLASILLHDIGRLYPELGKEHYSAGAKVAPKYLKGAGFTKKEIEKVVHCIRSYGPRGLEKPKSLEARVFDYFMREEKMSVKQMIEIPSGRKGPREDLYTRTGRKLGEKGL